MNLEKLAAVDPEINAAICEELGRQRNKIELIASENFVSPAVMEAMGTVLTNKYAEGAFVSFRSMRCYRSGVKNAEKTATANSRK